MKKMKFSIVIVAMLAIASLTHLNAQADRVVIDFEVDNWVECANDGVGENVYGWIKVLIITNPKGLFVAHPMGGYAVGDVTGIKYQAVGVTFEKVNSDPGANSHTWVNRYHLVGKGTHFYIKETYHAVMTPGGVWETKVEKSEVICK